jgi:transcription elongation GreA/GreB family factor
MSKAFTKEDDDAGFAPPSSSAKILTAPFRLTSAGAKKLEASGDPRILESLAHAERLPPVIAPARAALGVIVHVRTTTGELRSYRLVSGAERTLLGEGCSVEGPLGRALLGAEVGDTRELRAPRGVEEVEIIALEGE